MDIAAAHTAPQPRLFSPAPRHSGASRRLMTVRAGSPTILACILAFGVLAAGALGATDAHAKQLGTVAPVAHVATTTPAGI